MKKILIILILGLVLISGCEISGETVKDNDKNSAETTATTIKPITTTTTTPTTTTTIKEELEEETV